MSKAKILIVEDEKIVAMDIQKSLESMGYHVCAMASSGEEAVQKAGETKPDLALMDIVLKGKMDGIQTAEQLSARFKTPIVYLTAYDDDNTLQRAKITTPYAYITKPFNDRELHIAIEMALYKSQAETRIRRTEKWLAAILKSVGDGVIASDKEGRITFMNQTAENLTGWKKEDAFGKKLTEVLNLKDTDVSNMEKHLVEKVVTEGLIINLIEDRLLVAKDGTVIPISDSVAPIRDDDGERPGTVLVFRDITEHKKTESALRESEERFRTIFERSTIGKSLTMPNGKLLHVNKAFAGMLGYTIDEMQQFDFAQITHPDDLAKSRECVSVLLAGGRDDYRFEKRYISKSGDIVWAEVSSTLHSDKQGSPLFLITSIIDITMRKRMEAELLKADKLESVGILAGGIAHDFNNILTSIAGNISMAKLRLKPGDKVFDLLSSAETASMKAQGLTRQLLTFAKGGMPIKETASIQTLIKESSLFVLRGSKSECEFQIAEDLWPVEADVGQISQVISNILINANQAMPEGGTVQITAENLMPEKMREIPVKPGRYIHISINDQGVGIAEKHLSKIFDPYFTTKQAGSGLGLAVSYSIINKHNGHISVNSLPGAGATFDVYLPASDKEVPLKEEAVLLKGSGKILMMDDDEFLKELAKEMIDMLGYESGFAENGAEAIEMYRKAMESGKPYDAVILDLTIPGSMGGEEVIKILLDIDPEVKAIVCSGYSEGEVMSNFRKYGFKGMMPKPFDAYSLGKVLNEVLKDNKLVKET
jgi:PAS domain S-box-containing protein